MPNDHKNLLVRDSWSARKR